MLSPSHQTAAKSFESSTMNVFIESTLSGNASGHLEVNISPSETVDSLISAFCIDKSIRYRQQYVLKTRENVVLDSTKTIASCGVVSGEVLFLTTHNEEQKLFGFSNWWLLSAVAAVIGVIGLTVISVVYAMSGKTPPSYGIVFDAGSTHTAMTLYRWNAPKPNGTGLVTQVTVCTVDGDGISSYAQNPEKAGASLEKCLNSAVHKVPSDEKADSLVFLAATAGMRILDKSNHTAASAVMDSIRKTLSQSGFAFEPHQARIISGQEEGVFGWITANYLSDRLGNISPNISNTLGALDLGGASTQISFVANTSTFTDDYVPLKLYGVKYPVFSKSFLCFGEREMERRYQAQIILNSSNNTSEYEDPCGLSGYNETVPLKSIFNQICTVPWNESLAPITQNVTFVGTGNASGCHLWVQQLLNVTTCEKMNYTECFDVANVPPVRGDFLGFSAFFYVMKFYNSTNNLSLSKFDNQTRQFCGKPWDQVKNETSSKMWPYVVKYCLVGQYVVQMLGDAYKFDKDKTRVKFVDKVNGIDVGWSLGFMTNATNAIPSEPPVETLSELAFVGLVIIFAVFLLVAGAFALHGWKQSRRTVNYQRFSHYGTI